MASRTSFWLGVSTLACLVLVVSTARLGHQVRAQVVKDKAEPKPEGKLDVEKWIAGSKQAAVRRNGVLLKARLEIKSEPKGPLILLHWSMDYDGPRQPLIILKPTLEGPAVAQTYVVFYAIHADGKEYPIPIRGFEPRSIFPYFKESFVAVNKGEVAKGALPVIDANGLVAAAKEKWPVNFRRFEPKRLFVQLYHYPSARGEKVVRDIEDDRSPTLDLDAWTGRVQTELLEIPLEKLKVP